jgi:hypothetical protein
MIETAHSSSLINRAVARRRPAWVTVLLVALAYLPALVAAVSMSRTDLLTDPSSLAILRNPVVIAYANPTMIAYMLLIGPIIARMPPAVVRSLRPVILVDDQELAVAIRRASWITPLHEVAAIAAGLLLAAALFGITPEGVDTWPEYVIVATAYVTLGLAGWLVFTAIADARIVSRLLHLPLHIDPLDITPFEVIGRQSLIVAFSFIGAITISFALGYIGPPDLDDPRFWLLRAPFVIFPVVVFFWYMAPTQRVLSRAKKLELAAVQGQLHAAFRLLLERGEEAEATGNLSPDVNALATYVNALAAYEQHLHDASSWPYNPTIIRTLIFGILVPISTVLARRVFDVVIR